MKLILWIVAAFVSFAHCSEKIFFPGDLNTERQHRPKPTRPFLTDLTTERIDENTQALDQAAAGKKMFLNFFWFLLTNKKIDYDIKCKVKILSKTFFTYFHQHAPKDVAFEFPFATIRCVQVTI
jgi:hypothetical protein